MKTLTIIFLTVCTGLQAYSQVVQKQFTVSLPSAYSGAGLLVSDMDNDGLMDVIIMATETPTRSVIRFIPGDTVSIPNLHPEELGLPPYDTWYIHDIDRDNQLDILVSVTENGLAKSFYFRNLGNFKFEKRDWFLPAFSLLRVADLDGDGETELILSGQNESRKFTQTYKRKNPETWELTFDSLDVLLKGLEVIDINQDGRSDLIISGTHGIDSAFTVVMLMDSLNRFKIDYKAKHTGQLFMTDMAQDGEPEMVVFDINPFLKPYYIADQKTFETSLFTDSRNWTSISQAFIADLNSDGIVDEQYMGMILPADTVNILRSPSGDELLNSQYLQEQKWADFEHDGDLDLFQITGKDRLAVDYWINTTVHKNQGPQKPSFAMAVPIYDRLLLYWEKSTDDHTDQASLSYDLYIESVTPVLESSFDLLHGARLASAHGNNGFHNFKFIDNKFGSGIQYAIQAIDNAFHASSNSICTGQGISCVNTVNKKLNVCQGEKIQLTATSKAEWFSFNRGYLGEGETMSGTFHSSDTVFYFIPSSSGCAELGIFDMTISRDKIQLEPQELHACEGDVISLECLSCMNATWNNGDGLLNSGPDLIYRVESEDPIVLRYISEAGCEMEKEYTVRISKPVVLVTPAESTLLRDQSVQLTASGAMTYAWSPSTGLNNTGIPNPTASPSVDTRYTVIGTDDYGCQSMAEAFVKVEGSGFIPTLFSPNQDGKNDRLIVYGLTGVNEFSFSIYTRSGIPVYESNNSEDVSIRGWDGTSNGALLPNGVYFWKVKGTYASGKEINLNGKTQGSVVLIR